jgi:hypothetical protein
MIAEHYNYNQVVGIINQLKHCEQLKLLEDIKKIIAFNNKKKRIDNSWIGALSGKTKILGDIVAPVVEEEEWEVLSS